MDEKFESELPMLRNAHLSLEIKNISLSYVHIKDEESLFKMATKKRSVFFAYPGAPQEIVSTINSANNAVRLAEKRLDLLIWPQMDVFGGYIPDKIRESIDNSDVVVCDVTYPNRNVYYEIGYAIGKGKPVAPVLNDSISKAAQELQKDGIFDNIGYEKYENSKELSDLIIKKITNESVLNLYEKDLNHKQPLYFLDSYRKTDFRNSIVSAIKASKVYYRSFDPVETPRFSSVAMIAEITSSSGVIVPILKSNIDDSDRHNLRAAFLVGLSHGFGRSTLMLQMHTEQSREPADFRDQIQSVRNEEQIYEVVNEFAKEGLGRELING